MGNDLAHEEVYEKPGQGFFYQIDDYSLLSAIGSASRMHMGGRR